MGRRQADNLSRRQPDGSEPRQGPAYDLPIAVGLLRASGQVPAEPLAGAAFLGELSLDGALRHTAGMLPMVMVARAAGLRRAYVPAADAEEAVLVDGVEVVPVATLAGLVDQLRGHAPTALASAPPAAAPPDAGPGRAGPSRPPRSTCGTCAARPRSSARSRSRPPGGTTC